VATELPRFLSEKRKNAAALKRCAALRDYESYGRCFADAKNLASGEFQSTATLCGSNERIVIIEMRPTETPALTPGRKASC
jgi:hypothetical protein